MTIQEMQQRKTELGLTYEQIAERCGLATITVQRIMNGTTENPRPRTLEVIETALDYPEIPEKVIQYNYSRTNDREHTADDYYKLPDHQRYELIDGVLYDISSPDVAHQDICGELFFQLKVQARFGEGACAVRLSPSGIKLSERTVVQPDIYIQLRDNKFDKLSLVFAAEVVSDSTKLNDYIRKPEAYLGAGVREYWIVDYEKDRILVYNFDSDDPAPHIYRFHDPIPVAIWDNQGAVELGAVKRSLDLAKKAEKYE